MNSPTHLEEVAYLIIENTNDATATTAEKSRDLCNGVMFDVFIPLDLTQDASCFINPFFTWPENNLYISPHAFHSLPILRPLLTTCEYLCHKWSELAQQSSVCPCRSRVVGWELMICLNCWLLYTCFCFQIRPPRLVIATLLDLHWLGCCWPAFGLITLYVQIVQHFS